MDKKITDIFESIKGLNPYADFLDGSTLSKVKSWTSTGCYALNCIMSGSLYKGIPSGRVIGISGPESCGKTFILNSIFREAILEGRYVFDFDTENAQDEQTARNLGCDPSKIVHIPVDTTAEFKIQSCKTLDKIIENKLQGKGLLALDSLGNLEGTKENADVEKGKSVADQGTRAKDLKGVLRALTHRAARADVPCIFTNHTYADPQQLYPTIIKNQSGGSGPLYMPSITIQLAKKGDSADTTKQNTSKDAQEDSQSLTKGYNGMTVRALSIKNRFVPPFLETEFYINFSTGLSKYSGLLDIGLGYGAIVQSGSTYALPDGKKLGYYKNWRDDADLWETKIMPDLEIRLQNALKFGTFLKSKEVDNSKVDMSIKDTIESEE